MRGPSDVLRALNAFVDRWLALDASASECDVDNALCDSPWLESATREPTGPVLGCAVGGSGVGSWLVAMFAWLAFRSVRRSATRFALIGLALLSMGLDLETDRALRAAADASGT